MGSPVTPALMQGAFQGFSARFFRAYKSAMVWWMSVAMEIPSDTEENILDWLMQLPAVREWAGPRLLNTAALEAYRLTNKDYELSISIKRTKFEDDKYGAFGPLFGQMGEQFGKWPDRQIAALLASYSTQANCFDGKKFFATDHPVNQNDPSKSTYSNLKTSKALTYTNYVEQFALFQTQKGPNGEAMGLTADTLIVPPELRETALSIVGSSNVIQVFGSNTAAAARENPMAKTAQVVVVPELSSYSLGSTTWYLAQCGGEIKPFIKQSRKEPVFVSRTNLEDDNVFMKNEFQYGGDARAAFGYSFPWLCFRCEA